MNNEGDTKVRGTLIQYFDSLERLMKPRVQYCVCGHSIAAHAAGGCSDCSCSGFSDETKGPAHTSGNLSDPGSGA